MKKLLLSLSFIVYCSSSALAAEFPDVKSPILLEAVNYLNEQGIIKGYPDGTFKPDQVINRAEALKIIFESRGIAVEEDTNSGFPDVDSSLWFAKYVTSAKRLGLINGYADGTYKPTQPVNFAEFIKILVLANQIGDPGFDTYPISSRFPLIKENEWYEEFANIAYKNGLLSSFSSLDPVKSLSRNDATMIIYKTSLLIHEPFNQERPIASFFHYRGKNSSTYEFTTSDGKVFSSPYPLDMGVSNEGIGYFFTDLTNDGPEMRGFSMGESLDEIKRKKYGAIPGSTIYLRAVEMTKINNSVIVAGNFYYNQGDDTNREAYFRKIDLDTLDETIMKRSDFKNYHVDLNFAISKDKPAIYDAPYLYYVRTTNNLTKTDGTSFPKYIVRFDTEEQRENLLKIVEDSKNYLSYVTYDDTYFYILLRNEERSDRNFKALKVNKKLFFVELELTLDLSKLRFFGDLYVSNDRLYVIGYDRDESKRDGLITYTHYQLDQDFAILNQKSSTQDVGSLSVDYEFFSCGGNEYLLSQVYDQYSNVSKIDKIQIDQNRIEGTAEYVACIGDTPIVFSNGSRAKYNITVLNPQDQEIINQFSPEGPYFNIGSLESNGNIFSFFRHVQGGEEIFYQFDHPLPITNLTKFDFSVFEE